MKLTEKSMEVLDFVRAHDGQALVSEIAAGVGRTSRSVNANINDLVKKGLATRIKEDGAEEATCALTAEGTDFVPSED